MLSLEQKWQSSRLKLPGFIHKCNKLILEDIKMYQVLPCLIQSRIVGKILILMENYPSYQFNCRITVEWCQNKNQDIILS